MDGNAVLQSFQYWEDGNNSSPSFSFRMPRDKLQVVKTQFSKQGLIRAYNNSISFIQTKSDTMQFNGTKDQVCEVLSTIFDCLITKDLFDRYLLPTSPLNTPTTKPISNSPIQTPMPADSKDANQGESILSKYQIFQTSNSEIEIEDKDRKINDEFRNQKLVKELNGKLSCLKSPPSASIFHVEEPDASQLFDLTSQALSRIFKVNITESLLRRYTTSKPAQNHQPPPKQPAQVPPPKQPAQVPTRTPKSDKPDVLELDSKLYFKLLDLCGLPPNSPSIKQIIFQPDTE